MPAKIWSEAERDFLTANFERYDHPAPGLGRKEMSHSIGRDYFKKFCSGDKELSDESREERQKVC
jgi:hypothetical protein